MIIMDQVEGLIATTRVNGRGKTQIPAELVKKMGLIDGDKLAWYEDADGTVFIRKILPKRGYAVQRG